MYTTINKYLIKLESGGYTILTTNKDLDDYIASGKILNDKLGNYTVESLYTGR